MFKEMYDEFLIFKKVASPEELEEISKNLLNKIAGVAQVGKEIAKMPGAAKAGKGLQKAMPLLNVAAYKDEVMDSFKDAFKNLNKPINIPKPGV
jgi:hypothetical protein